MTLSLVFAFPPLRFPPLGNGFINCLVGLSVSLNNFTLLVRALDCGLCQELSLVLNMSGE